ncbi:putative Amastin surface glycoprotein [Leishmania shawi]|uniref:Amastin surface glycoprotein n=1 Tax=Leishmania shawi TaxID=5680 RepID=A0AAW3CDJ1_9TRYP
MEWSIGLLVYVVVQFVAFFLVLVATHIDMFRYRPDGSMLDNECITLWSSKNNCASGKHDISSDGQWAACPPRRDRFRAAQAFVIISIFVYGTAFVLGVIMLLCNRCFRWVCLALNSVGAVTLFIVWVAMAVTYSRNEGFGCLAPKAFHSYGAGFVLLVLAWLPDILNIPVLLFLCQDNDSGESGSATENKSQEREEEKKETERQA